MCNPTMKPPGACNKPDRAFGRRETNVELQVKGNNKHLNVSMVSVRSVPLLHIKATFASRRRRAKTASICSTLKQRKGAAKSKSI